MKYITPLFIVAACVANAQAQTNQAAVPTTDSVKISITNLADLNSKFGDYAPVISADGSELMFTSRRPVTPHEVKKDQETFERIYISDYDTTTKKWSAPQLLPSVLNVGDAMNSAIALSNDGQRILLYRDEAMGNGDLWESTLKGTQWNRPEKLQSPINSKYLESTASISPDGWTLYFVSNRPGGLGGRDIWSITQDSVGKLGEAKNLGAPVNTDQDEEGVFIHPDGKTLYFSSKGHGGFGGYDIFRSTREHGKWSTPVNMGEPINTAGDDVFFVMEANGKIGFLSSNRPGGSGGQDIYQVNFISIKKEKKDRGPKLTLFKGMVVDDQTLKPVGTTIDIIDNEKSQQVSKLTSNNATGKFMISLPSGKNYGISINAPGYLFYSDNFNIPDTTAYQEVNKVIKLKKLEVGVQIVLNNIFYDFDKASLRNESISELNKVVKLLNDNSTMQVEIASYTDNKGSDDYNMKLSQARAQSVVDYLISKGIGKDRLVPKGYGKSNPIASNDTDEGRQINRRTEFKILHK